MLRTLAKSSIASSMHWSGLDSLLGARKGLNKMPLILCYHRVVEDFEESAKHSIPSILVSTKTFEDHLDWIGSRYDFVSLDELAALPDGMSRSGRPVAAITFDDGYADVCTNAVPILKRKGIPSASFVVTDLIGTSQLQLHDELYLLLSGALRQWKPSGKFTVREFLKSLNLDPYVSISLCFHTKHINESRDPFKLMRVCFETLTHEELSDVIHTLRALVPVPSDILDGFKSVDWSMIRSMIKEGVTIGSHTKSHVLLVNETNDTVIEELKESREVLEENLGIPIKHFAYPDGRFDTISVNGVHAAGYDAAYTICMHRSDAHPELTIPRRVLWERSCMDSLGRFSPAIMSCQVNGLFEPALRCQQRHSQ